MMIYHMEQLQRIVNPHLVELMILLLIIWNVIT